MIRRRYDEPQLIMDVETGPLQIHDDQRRTIEKAATTIRRRIHGLPDAHLWVKVSQPLNHQNSSFEVDLRIDLSGRSLSASGQGPDLARAIGNARDKIVSQLGPLRASLRREQTYRRGQADQSVEQGASSEASRSADSAEVERSLERYWQPLLRQVGREITVLELNGDLPHGELTARDIVDDVIVQVHEHFHDRPPQLPLEIWLYQQARDLLARRRKDLGAETPMSFAPAQRLREPPASNPPWEDEQILADLIEPEPEPMLGEDIADQIAPNDPSLSLRRDELRQAFHEVMGRMPSTWREAVWLHYLDGFDVPEIAAVQQADPQQVRDDLHTAVSRLRDALYSWRGWQAEARDEAQIRNHSEDHVEPPNT